MAKVRMSDEFHESLLVAQYTHPEERLAQLLFNAIADARPGMTNEEFHEVFFYLKDRDLVNAVLNYARPKPKETPCPVTPFNAVPSISTTPTTAS